jgi:serine/threonine protein kinase
MTAKNEFSFTTDLWSIACMLFEMLTGKPLFDGANGPKVRQLVMACDIENNLKKIDDLEGMPDSDKKNVIDFI